jgi:hypothetical protein
VERQTAAVTYWRVFLISLICIGSFDSEASTPLKFCETHVAALRETNSTRGDDAEFLLSYKKSGVKLPKRDAEATHLERAEDTARLSQAALRDPTPDDQWSTHLSIDSFLDGGIWRRAIFRMTELAQFQKNLNRFFLDHWHRLKDGGTVDVQIALGRTAQITAKKFIEFDAYKTELHINIDGHIVKMQVGEHTSWDSNTGMIHYSVGLSPDKNERMVGLYYATRTFDETENRAKAMNQKLVAMMKNKTKEEVEEWNRDIEAMMATINKATPDNSEKEKSSEYEIPKTFAEDSANLPLIPYVDRAEEADGRVQWPQDTSGYMKAYELLSTVVDAIYNEGKNIARIETIPPLFEEIKKMYIQDYFREAKGLRAYEKILATIQPNNAGMNYAEITESSQIPTRFKTIGEDAYYGSRSANPDEWKDLPPNQPWLTWRIGHWFQAVSLDSMKKNQLNLFTRNLQQTVPEKTYHFEIDSNGSLKTPLNTSTIDASRALHSILDVFEWGGDQH